MTEPAIWLFDGQCVLCSRAVQFSLRHERSPEIQFVAIQSSTGRRIAEEHKIDPDNPESFLFIVHGRAHAKSDGMMVLASHLRGWPKMLMLGRVVPKFIRDWLYDRMARNRYQWFGKTEKCFVPTADTWRRFTLPDTRAN